MPAVYQLLLFPGTGKLTIANEIVKQLRAPRPGVATDL
jgi:hypothetical protein